VAHSRLQASVTRLRQVLPAGTIHTLPHGYRLELDAQELDALQWAAGDFKAPPRRFALGTRSPTTSSQANDEHAAHLLPVHR
jgi:hypothetical protein